MYCIGKSFLLNFMMADKATSSSVSFEIKLYKNLASTTAGNVFVSPHSITVALVMILLGTKENTMKELKYALQIDDVSDKTLHNHNLEVLKQLTKDKDNVVLETASKLFPATDFVLATEYLEKCLHYYNVSLETLNFMNEIEESRRTINNWAQRQTKDKIKDLLPEGSISADTKLVLANAVYFKGNWLEKFKETRTSEMDFHCKQGEVSKVKMMVKEREYFNYCEEKELGVQVVELPYVGNEYSMLLVVPIERFGITTLEENLTSDKLSALTMKLTREEITIGLPKMKIEYAADLVPTLKSLGVYDLFDETKANLEGISSTPGLYVSGIFHKTFLEVNEEGTEAAAATGETFILCSAPSPCPVIVCDHPFMFLIRHIPTQTNLFVGRFTGK